MRQQRILPVAVIALTLSASVLTAQGSVLNSDPVVLTEVAGVPTSPIAEPTVSIAGPRLDRARIGIAVQNESASGALVPTPQPSISRKRGVPQMIIGGAAILGGAIVGGDAGGIVSIAGLGYGLYGLYLYLQ